ncbi:MAG: YihY/virulence factor BrkB family protein [Fibrobacterales bacterium]
MKSTTKANILLLCEVFLDSLKNFVFHKGIIRATALAFDSAIAFIPVVIIVSAIANLFGVFNLLPKILPEINRALNLGLPLEGVLQLIKHAEGIEFQSLGFMGFTILLFTFWFAMSTLEESMNMAWRIQKNRNPFKKIIAYTPILFFFLIALLIMSAFMFNVKAEIHNLIETSGAFSDLESLLYLGTYNIFFAVLTWITLNVIYFHIPNTKVPFPASLFASTLTTILLFFFLAGVIKVQGLMMARYSLLYGSLASFPLFMILIFGLWVIILMGNEISYQVKLRFLRKERLEELMLARKVKHDEKSIV